MLPKALLQALASAAAPLAKVAPGVASAVVGAVADIINHIVSSPDPVAAAERARNAVAAKLGYRAAAVAISKAKKAVKK